MKYLLITLMVTGCFHEQKQKTVTKFPCVPVEIKVNPTGGYRITTRAEDGTEGYIEVQDYRSLPDTLHF